MTDDDFQSILNGENRRDMGADKMAEGLDLASQAVGEGEPSRVANEPKGVVHQPVDEVAEKQTEEEEEPKSATPQSEPREGEKESEEEVEVQPEGPETIAPTMSKSKAVKRELVFKAGANTAVDAVEIHSEDERATPTKPGEEPLKTSQEDALSATRTTPPTPNDQEEEAEKVAEGLDLASKSVGQDEAIDDDTSACVVAKPTT
ncbi:triadin-like [Salvia hispanica]|uniref:triadin-like n=1 Tax=Salvia hispanica TaxID=49212 RepID=UPI002009BC50|nr:triadin-like [Salvia hispanica]